MDNQRLILIIALTFVGLLLFQQWQLDYGPKPETPTSSDSTPVATGADIPAVNETPSVQASNPELPPLSTPAQEAKPVVVSGEDNRLPSAQRVRVETDTIYVELDTYGGDIRQVDLKKYPATQEQPDVPFRLMTDQGARLFVAQSGHVMRQGNGPDHTSQYRAARSEYRLGSDQNTLEVPLVWTSEDGIKVTKTYVFKRGSHAIEVRHKVENNSGQSWQGSFYRQLQRTQYPEATQSMFIYTYMGGVIYTPEEKYEKIDFSDMLEEKLDRKNIVGGWTAMMQHYFLGAWVPPANATNNFYSLERDYRYFIGMNSPLVTVEPGQSHEFESILYAGPKVQEDLEKLAEGLELTVDYGFLTVIAKPLFWLLDLIHSFVGNWGWAIVILTLLIKLVFYKLSETSYKSMANMRKLQPRMKALKERYGDDKQKMNQALMELYRKEKINPLGGCLPILIQIPVFIALYWVLLESVELRQAPWILWIDDLSAKDPYFVLPIIMGASMFIQQKLNPAPIDPVQAKIMMFLPLVFTVFFLFFPAGLVLYWVVNNVLSIAQQWVITKRITESKA